MAQKITASQLLTNLQQQLLIDVRTPAEFAQGHIPGAHNIPLFSDEEGVVIGTAYKQQSKEQAMLIALEYIGPRMRQLIEQTQKLMQHARTKKVMVHCWRGGMRSASLAWLLEFFGYEVLVLEGGYKAFCAHIRAAFVEQKQLRILSGPTGSGKSKLLQQLQIAREQVIDLEALAHHKGSVFGGLGIRRQPSQEQFENDLGIAWLRVAADRPVWIEDESRKIGNVHIPDALWEQMRHAGMVRIQVPREQRIEHLCAEYGIYTTQELIACVQRLEKHLGGACTQEIITLLHQRDLRAACSLLLHHYDATYAYSFAKRTPQFVHDIADHAPEIQKIVCI